MKTKLKKIFKNKKILITGHTGFKGSWLTLWLSLLGARVTGISFGYPTFPSHFKVIKIAKRINHKILDIRNFQNIKKTIKKIQPDFIFHLAAQSLVQTSYKDPLLTWSSNTLGSINILESLKVIKKNCNVIMITSDKSYKNLEIKRGYKENDLLGGYDPYSASKASAELAIQSYVNSYFNKNKNIKICIARAGNVIGGGDWSKNRIIPDCYKSWSKNKRAIIRNPNSTRPWQHVQRQCMVI
jgi:CDP-glucose 4,6-dehydratase